MKTKPGQKLMAEKNLKIRYYYITQKFSYFFFFFSKNNQQWKLKEGIRAGHGKTSL